MEELALLDKNSRRLFFLTTDEKKYYQQLLDLFEMFGCYLVRLIKSPVKTYTYKYTPFSYLNVGLGGISISTKSIFPSKGTIFKFL
jgi:hypothetical protein